jgi:hypothetical protein
MYVCIFREKEIRLRTTYAQQIEALLLQRSGRRHRSVFRFFSRWIRARRRTVSFSFHYVRACVRLSMGACVCLWVHAFVCLTRQFCILIHRVRTLCLRQIEGTILQPLSVSVRPSVRLYLLFFYLFFFGFFSPSLKLTKMKKQKKK